MNDANQPLSPLGDSTDPTELTLDWGMTSLPLSDTPANFFVMGAIGSGKDISLRLLMQSALRMVGTVADHRALIFDPKGNMESLPCGIDLRCPVHLLNPFDRRGAAWDIAADISSPTAALRLAASLIPEDDLSAQPFFTDAARQLLAAACLSFHQMAPGRWTLRDVLLGAQSRERLHSILARGPDTAVAAQSFLSGERHGTNVLATLNAKLHPLEAIAACWQDATNKLSLKRWLTEESVILLADPPVHHNSIAPVNQAIFGCLADLTLAHQESPGRRTWIFLDEVDAVGPFDSLPPLMQRGRPKGVCVALGFRGIDGIRRHYGPQAAEQLTESCSHKTALRTDNPETADWAERHFGPPLRAADLMSLPLTGPEHGFTAIHEIPKTGTHGAHRSWDWVQSKLRPPKEIDPAQFLRPPDEPHLRDWTDEDYRRLGFDDPPPSSPG